MKKIVLTVQPFMNKMFYIDIMDENDNIVAQTSATYADYLNEIDSFMSSDISSIIVAGHQEFGKKFIKELTSRFMYKYQNLEIKGEPI